MIGIDAGFANHACCALDYDWRRPVRWTNERIMEGKYTEEKLWQATFKWCQANREMLEQASMIVLERQIEAPFKMMNTMIRTLHPHTAVIVSPATVGKRFGLSKTRKEKKEDAVNLVTKNLIAYSGMPKSKKKDDLADSYLLALWGLEKLEVSTEGWKN